MQVTRKVDTVLMEMDVSIAEQLLEVLELVQDNVGGLHRDGLNDLRVALHEHVRYPSPLYRAVAHNGYVEINDRFN